MFNNDLPVIEESKEESQDAEVRAIRPGVNRGMNMEVKEKLEEFENKEEEADFRENLFMLHCSIACHDSISESQAIEAE